MCLRELRSPKTPPPIKKGLYGKRQFIKQCGNNFKLRETLKDDGYQALDESLMWLRKKLRYGKNATYDKENKKIANKFMPTITQEAPKETTQTT